MKITLNKVQYDIDSIQEKQVTPFTAKISSGTVEWGDYAPCSIHEYRDFRGGLGLESEEKPSGRFYWSNGAETTKEGYLTLGPLVSTAGAFGVQPSRMEDFTVSGTKRTFVIGNSICKYWTTDWQQADASALATPTDSMVVTDGTATYLVICNGVDVRYTSDGTTWSTLSSSNVKYMCMFDKRLIGIDAAYKTIYHSDRDNIDDAATGAMDSFTISGDYSVVTDLFEGKLLTTGEPCIYMLTDTGLHAIDFYTQTCWKMEVRYPYTTNARVGMYWNSFLYIGTGQGIARVTPGQISQWGTDTDDGLPAAFQGYVYDMVGTSHWVLMCMAGGTNDSIFKRHESTGGWNQVYSSSSAIECIHYSPASMFTNGRLWFGDGTNVKYIEFPDTTHDVTKVSSYNYCASGDMYLTRFSRVSAMPKVGLSLEAVVEDLNDGEIVTPYYILNDPSSLTATDWTELDEWRTEPKVSSVLNSGSGERFYDITFRLHLQRGSTTTKSPKVKSIGFKYLPLPSTISSWVFNVKAEGNRAKEIVDSLITARDNSVLCNFSPDGDTNISEKFVRIVSMPSRRELEGISAERLIQVTVTEVF
uniref:Uncharacterized protein n=1 Tax=viral metagenome TaxID=1070528 RepID=A0A6M3KFA0_9ZZZZ